MKTAEELNAMRKKLTELSDEELAQVSGGERFEIPWDANFTCPNCNATGKVNFIADSTVNRMWYHCYACGYDFMG